mmetsp:Transcript_5881/g.15951  ORF Transcript_5881/g.15951 Transcript_5881/m.15951 type:complete len:203 (+) Transcript_5881:2322-2930(+)
MNLNGLVDCITAEWIEHLTTDDIEISVATGAMTGSTRAFIRISASLEMAAWQTVARAVDKVRLDGTIIAAAPARVHIPRRIGRNADGHGLVGARDGMELGATHEDTLRIAVVEVAGERRVAGDVGEIQVGEVDAMLPEEGCAAAVRVSIDVEQIVDTIIAGASGSHLVGGMQKQGRREGCCNGDLHGGVWQSTCRMIEVLNG